MGSDRHHRVARTSRDLRTERHRLLHPARPVTRSDLSDGPEHIVPKAVAQIFAYAVSRAIWLPSDSLAVT